MDPGLALALLAAVGVAIALAVAVRAMGWVGGRKGRSTGIAGGLAELNEILQPQLPRAEQLERLREGEAEADESGTGKDRDQPRP